VVEVVGHHRAEHGAAGLEPARQRIDIVRHQPGRWSFIAQMDSFVLADCTRALIG
jgi:hypothetical protein